MANSYDVWLVRLERRDAVTMMAVARRFGVDAPAASQLVAKLPRVVAVDVSSTVAEGIARDLRKLGGMPHLVRTGQAPDFDGKSVQTSAAPPSKRKRIGRSVKDEAARAKRTRQDDAESLRWPDDAAPPVWDPHPKQPPPPVPRPVRNSAARVLASILGVSVLAAGGLAAWWFTVGVQERSWASASFATPDAGTIAAEGAPSSERAKDATEVEAAEPDLELAESLTPKLASEGWKELVAHVSDELDEDAAPFRVGGREVGVEFSVHARDTLRLFKRLQVDVRHVGASMFRASRGDAVTADRVALVPLSSAAEVVRLVGTSGPTQGVSNEDVQGWLRVLAKKQPFFLMGAGARFVQGRFEVGVRDESVLSQPIYRCPGAANDGDAEEAEPPAGGTQTIETLNALRKGERFSCNFR